VQLRSCRRRGSLLDSGGTSSASSADLGGHRSEFVGLVRRVREWSTAETPLPVQSHGISEESFACARARGELIGAGLFLWFLVDWWKKEGGRLALRCLPQHGINVGESPTLLSRSMVQTSLFRTPAYFTIKRVPPRLRGSILRLVASPSATICPPSK
jgi:hypothetical protein